MTTQTTTKPATGDAITNYRIGSEEAHKTLSSEDSELLDEISQQKQNFDVTFFFVVDPDNNWEGPLYATAQQAIGALQGRDISSNAYCQGVTAFYGSENCRERQSLLSRIVPAE